MISILTNKFHGLNKFQKKLNPKLAKTPFQIQYTMQK